MKQCKSLLQGLWTIYPNTISKLNVACYISYDLGLNDSPELHTSPAMFKTFQDKVSNVACSLYSLVGQNRAEQYVLLAGDKFYRCSVKS